MNVNIFLLDDRSAIDKMREKLEKYSEITVFEFSSFDDFVNRYILDEEMQEQKDRQIGDKYCENKRVIIIRTDDGDKALKLEDIEYITVFNHTSVLYTINRKIHRINLSLKNLLEEKLDKMFVRCHRGYIVNLKHIKEINRNKIMLNDSVVIEVGRAYKSDVVKKYNMYIRSEL